MAYRAIPSRMRLVLWLFSHCSADATSSSSEDSGLFSEDSGLFLVDLAVARFVLGGIVVSVSVPTATRDGDQRATATSKTDSNDQRQASTAAGNGKDQEQRSRAKINSQEER